MTTNTTEGNRQDVPAPPALTQPEPVSCPRKGFVPAQRWGTVLGHPSKGHGQITLAPPALFREGNSLFLSHPVHQHPWGRGGRGFHHWGDPQALPGGSDTLPLNGAVTRTPSRPSPFLHPKRHLVPQHSPAAASKHSTCHFPQV